MLGWNRGKIMDITSPFFVVPLIAVVFLAGILWATLTGKDKHSSH